MVKAKTKLAAMLSGGSLASASVTCAAKIVAVQASPGAKSAFGLIVKVDAGEAGVTTVSAGFLVPLVVQTIWNQLPVTLTDSLNVTVMSVLVGLIEGAVRWRGVGNGRRQLLLGRSKAENKIRRHLVRRIDYVLIRNLCGNDRDRAGLGRRKISIGIDRESSWTTAYGSIGDISCSSLSAGDLEPVARDVDCFAKGDRDVRILCDLSGAVSRRCVGNTWRSINVKRYERSVVWCQSVGCCVSERVISFKASGRIVSKASISVERDGSALRCRTTCDWHCGRCRKTCVVREHARSADHQWGVLGCAENIRERKWRNFKRATNERRVRIDHVQKIHARGVVWTSVAYIDVVSDRLARRSLAIAIRIGE